MALKYFVYKGMQLTTATVRSNDDFPGGDVDAVTLESVAAVLGATTTPPNNEINALTGTDATAWLNALKGYWNVNESGIDFYKKAARQVLAIQSPLLTNPLPDIDAPTPTYNFHKTSNTYILPINLIEAAKDLPDAVADITIAKQRLLIEALSVRHDNIEKHANAADAWNTYIAYTITSEFQDDVAIAESNYLIQ